MAGGSHLLQGNLLAGSLARLLSGWAAFPFLLLVLVRIISLAAGGFLPSPTASSSPLLREMESPVTAIYLHLKPSHQILVSVNYIVGPEVARNSWY